MEPNPSTNTNRSEIDAMIRGAHDKAAVVVVEPDNALVDLFLDLLQEVGIMAVGCNSVSEARVLIAQHQPQLVLLDIAAPNDHCIQLFHDLREQPSTASTVVMVVTAVPEFVPHAVLNDLYNRTFLVAMPFNLDNFHQTLERILPNAFREPIPDMFGQDMRMASD